jgi:hypothetical protein
LLILTGIFSPAEGDQSDGSAASWQDTEPSDSLPVMRLGNSAAALSKASNYRELI